MTVDEIVNYIMSGSRSLICISREKLERLDLFVEEHLDSPLEDWENVTKSGHLSLCEEEIDNDLYQEQEVIFKNDLRFGEVLLPAGIIWVKRAD